MKPTLRMLGLIALLVAAPLAGCTGEKKDADADEAAETIPTQEELDAAASEEITEENADAAFEELQKEIEEDK